MRFLLFLLPLAAGCSASGVDAAGSDTAASGPFCSTLDDGGTSVVEDIGGNDSSGDIDIRMLTTESSNISDPLYIAFKDYTLQNVDQGGVPTVGQTTGDGLVEQLVGAGNWDFQASYARGSTTCTADLTLPVQANSTTHGCAVMTCP